MLRTAGILLRSLCTAVGCSFTSPKASSTSMSQNPTDRSSDYHPSVYSQNRGLATAPLQGAPLQPTPPAIPQNIAGQQIPAPTSNAEPAPAEPIRTPSASHATTTPKPPTLPSPRITSHPVSAVPVPTEPSVAQDAGIQAPPLQPLSSTANAQNTGSGGALAAQRAPTVTPAHSRTPSAAISRAPSAAVSRPPSAAISQSRTPGVAPYQAGPRSVAHGPDVFQMRQPSRPPSGFVHSSTGQAQTGQGPWPFTAHPPPISTSRPASAHLSNSRQQPLPAVPEALAVHGPSSIPAAVWGDLAVHVKHWRKCIRQSQLADAELRRAFELVDKVEDAATAQEVAILQQDLLQLLPGIVIPLAQPGQINAAPPSLPQPSPSCDYPSPASGGYASEVQQPQPLQHGPSPSAFWLHSPSASYNADAAFYGQQYYEHAPGAQPSFADPAFASAHSSFRRAPASQPPVSAFPSFHGPPSSQSHPAFQQAPPQRPPRPPAQFAAAAPPQSPAADQLFQPHPAAQAQFAAAAQDSFPTAPDRPTAAAESSLERRRAPENGLAAAVRPSYASAPAPQHGAFPAATQGSFRRSHASQAGFATAAPPSFPSAPVQQHGRIAPTGQPSFQRGLALQGQFATPASPPLQSTPVRQYGQFEGDSAALADLEDGSFHFGAVNEPRGLENTGRPVQQRAPSAAGPASTPLDQPVTAAPQAQAAVETQSPVPPAPPAGQRSVAAPTRDGRSKQRGNAATVCNDSEDAPMQALRLPFAQTPRGNYKSRRRRDEDVVQELQTTFLNQRRVIFALADRLGEDPIALLREVNMGTGFGKENPWNLFQQFYSMPPGDWDVRDQYDFGTLSAHDAWEEFQKNADHERILLRFGWTFAEPAAVKTVGKMDKLFFGVRDHLMEVQMHLSAVHGIQLSFLMAGQNSITDGAFVCSEMAPNAQTFFDMFGTPLDVLNRIYQNHVQHIADMNEIAGRVGIPVPRSSLNLQRIPKLTDPALYKGWDLARIYNDNLTPWYEAANPQIVPVPKRAGECLFLVHQLINMKNELCLDNWPWWLPLPYSPGLNSDHGLQCYGTRETSYVIQWLCMRDPSDPTRPHPLGPRLCFAGERTDPETPLPTIRTTPVNCESSSWHKRVITYAVATHNLLTATGAELRAWRQLTGEIDTVYGFKHRGRDPRDKAAEDALAAESAARSKARRRVVSNALVDSDVDAAADEENAMDLDEPEQPAAAAGPRTRSQVAAAPPPPPVDNTPAALPQPPVMYDGHMPTDGPPTAYWLPSSGSAVVGFPGGVPDNFSVWTCAFAKDQRAGKWTGYKAALTKARKKTVQRIALGQPAPPQRPINNGGIVNVELVEEEQEEIEEALTNKRARLEIAQEGRGRGVTATPSKRKAPAAAAASTPKSASAAAAATSSRTPTRRSAAAATASTSTPSRASAAAAGGTPQAARTPGRQLTIDIPRSRANTPAPPPAEKHFRASMLDKPEGPVPEWLPRVPTALEPASVQTAYYRVGVAMKRQRVLPEEFCLVLEDLLDAWPKAEIFKRMQKGVHEIAQVQDQAEPRRPQRRCILAEPRRPRILHQLVLQPQTRNSAMRNRTSSLGHGDH
ncbi:hypothetical protein AURDEDRAFT_130105 [Auricularia subglabra TFB-10046 SS5]|uniref:Uncharacterized protein n=1 Tax=Auricularia subglabra (strain TFB-10046 / SS5) TaxID=717982 RepID=J0WUE3_AURST|nr:hypothetical protein AURDEDRAFT_130105 [Auricularia subglabra TFB-10046 SS5]